MEIKFLTITKLLQNINSSTKALRIKLQKYADFIFVITPKANIIGVILLKPSNESCYHITNLTLLIGDKKPAIELKYYSDDEEFVLHYEFYTTTFSHLYNETIYLDGLSLLDNPDEYQSSLNLQNNLALFQNYYLPSISHEIIKCFDVLDSYFKTHDEYDYFSFNRTILDYDQDGILIEDPYIKFLE